MKEKIDIALRPNIVPWPPIILGSSLIIAILLSVFLPIQLAFMDWLNVPGLVLIVLGITLDIWAMRTMFREKTNIRPDQAADKLVSSGPFEYTRNPIYLGNTIALFGIGLGFSHIWFLVMGLVHATLIYILAIRREEAHLAAKFGREWDNYRNGVPRWLGPI